MIARVSRSDKGFGMMGGFQVERHLVSIHFPAPQKSATWPFCLASKEPPPMSPLPVLIDSKPASDTSPDLTFFARERQAAFLAALAGSGLVRPSAEQAGVIGPE